MCLVVLTLDYFVTVIVTPEDLLVEKPMKILLFFGDFCVCVIKSLSLFSQKLC